MADEIHGHLPRGVAVTRRHGPPPWRVLAGDSPSLHVVVQGSFLLSQDGVRVLDLAPFDLVLLGAGPPGAQRRQQCLRCVATPSGAAPAELLSATYAPASDGALAALAPLVHLAAADVRRAPGLSALVSLLRSTLAGPSAGRERLASSLLEPLLAYTLHCHGLAREGHAARAFDRRVARVLQLMQAKPAERWTVEALARAAGLSRAAFARRFLAELGVPPLRYLADLRMQRAAELLAEGDASLASIAAEVGYDSEFAFSRAFKRHTGEAPGAFRRRSRSQGASFRLPPVRAAA